MAEEGENTPHESINVSFGFVGMFRPGFNLDVQFSELCSWLSQILFVSYKQLLTKHIGWSACDQISERRLIANSKLLGSEPYVPKDFWILEKLRLIMLIKIWW